MPANRFYKTVDWKEVVSDFHSRNPVLAEHASATAIRALKGFCVRLMSSKYPTYLTREGEDLLQSAYMAIHANLEKYDPERGEPTTFFAPYIEHAMMDFMNDSVNFTTIHYQTMYNKIKVFERSVPDEEVSKRTGLSPLTVKRTREIFDGNQKYSLDNFEEYGVLVAKQPTPEEEFTDQEEESLIYKWLEAELTPTEKEIIYYSFGLGDYQRLTTNEICELLDIPKSTIEETRARAYKKLANSNYSPFKEDERGWLDG